jgi:two-component system, sensor histidine kinase and response regulator
MDYQPIKILVIEDEQYIRENIQELLEAKGYKVRTAANGKQGVLEAIDYRPNLIVCDVMMPKMDGFKVLEYVRKTSTIQNIPFILLTAKVDKTDIRMGMELGADDYITKPFSAKDLVKAIETRLKRYEKINTQYTKVKHELDTNVFATYYHEFNTPLHGIIGGLNLLINAGGSFNEKQVYDLHVSILKSAIRLNHSLANLMLFEEIKRAEIYTELLTMFSNGQSTGNWHLKIKEELQTLAKEIYNREADLNVEIEPAELAISQEYLLRIIVEITDNAFKFSKSGFPIQVKGIKQADGYSITVVDKGMGFAIGSITDIGPFKQFNRRKFEQQGLGIGLHLVKQLIEFNRGELNITSLENQGTTIEVKLPLLDIA